MEIKVKLNGKNVIGHISYTYNGEDVGGADIYYDATDAATKPGR